MGSTLRSHGSEKGGASRPYRCFALPITHHPDPSSYFPNSLRRRILGSCASPCNRSYYLLVQRGGGGSTPACGERKGRSCRGPSNGGALAAAGSLVAWRWCLTIHHH